MTKLGWLVLAGLIATAYDLEAQVRVGESVRVWDRWGQPTVGVATGVSDQGVLMGWRTDHGEDRGVAPGTKVEVLRPGTRVWEGAGVGAVLGMLVGGKIADAIFKPRFQEVPDAFCIWITWSLQLVQECETIRVPTNSRFSAVAGGAGIGSLVGIALGAGIGYRLITQRWHQVEILEPTLLATRPGKWEVGLSFPVGGR